MLQAYVRLYIYIYILTLFDDNLFPMVNRYCVFDAVEFYDPSFPDGPKESKGRGTKEYWRIIYASVRG